jgi:hypothetical protein
MLLAAMMLPTAVSAQNHIVTSTFTGMANVDNEESLSFGTLVTSEGNDWNYSGAGNPNWPSYVADVGGFALSLKKEVIRLTNAFNLKGYIKKVTVRAGGNLSQIYAYISGGGSGYVCEMGTVDVKSSEVQDYEIYVADSWGETSLADNVDASRGVCVKITPGSGNEATILESITMEYVDELLPEGTYGTIGDLTWKVERDCYLIISGSGPMPDFEKERDTPWHDFFITGVEVKEGVTSIGDNAFDGEAVYGITLPKKSLRRIGKDAFFSNNFSSIDLPEGLEEIDNQAFAYTGLESITIPSTVSSIGSFVFNGCSAIETMAVAAGNPTYSSPGNCNAIIKTAEKELTYGCKNTIIPDDVLTIGDYAFFGCAMEGLDIPANITKIGRYAFYDCKSLKDIVLLDNVESIGQYAFSGCSAMETMTIGSGVTFIGKEAFSSLNNLTDITCTANPENLTWEGNSVASCCKSDGTTKFHVTDPDAWKAKFPDAHVQFVAIGSAETVEGDVSGDGKTDAEDVVALMNYIAGMTASISATAADVNKDGKVDVADIIALVNLIFGK